MKLLIILISIFLSLSATDTASKMTPKQLNVLQQVRNVAKSIPDRNGKTYENTLSAICLAESSAGSNMKNSQYKKSLTKSALGPMQIQVATARDVSKNVDKLKWLNGLSDVQLAKKLTSDIDLSARIATHYVILLHEKRGTEMCAISGYNGGYVNRPYYKKIMKNQSIIDRLISSGKLS